VQWGYLALFGAAAPGVVCLAFITNFLETRSDGYKLLRDYRRVLPRRIDGIGEALNIFYVIVYIAVLVNAGLVVYTFGAFTSVANAYGKACLFVLLNLFLMALVHKSFSVFPDIPKETEIQLHRQVLSTYKLYLYHRSITNLLIFTRTVPHLSETHS
jgi:hypothetical protein